MRTPHALILACLWASVGHAALIGTAYDSNLAPNAGALYLIDSVTGATAPLGRNFYLYGLADSPFPATLFGSSPVNLYTLNLGTGVKNYYNSASNLEMAYDAGNNVMYTTSGRTLFTVPMSPCSGPGCPPLRHIGDLPIGPFWALGYVPGEGLYGVDSVLGLLLRFDTSNAALTFIGPTGIGTSTGLLGITDIEFDPATGRMIAVAGGPESPFGTPALPFGKIYALDRTSGSLTLLNDNAPNFFGLAVATPEPSGMLLAAGALVLLGLKLRRRD